MRDVSVVIPARNAATTLAETLRSILVAPEVGEVIVVDDGSTDQTATIARSIKDPRIRVILGPQSGIAAALNVGFAAVKLPFVARCDADDLYPPDRLEWQRDWLLKNPAFIGVSGGFATMFPDGAHAADLACTGDARDVTDLLLNGETATHLCAWLLRSDAIAKCGGARTWFVSAEDVDLQFRLAEIGHVWHVPKIAYFYRLHDASITHRSDFSMISFFDKQARYFAKERRSIGKDRLELGHPPKPPSDSVTSRSKTSALDHATGQVIGAAWKEFEENVRGDAYLRLRATLLQRPLSRTLWWHVLILNAKHIKRSIF